jgi:translation initiation factor eIF-2B subunit beta
MSSSLRTKLDTAVLGLQRGVLSGGLCCTKLTLEILRELIVATRFKAPSLLMRGVRQIGLELMAAAPHELCIGNVTRRVLFIIREEITRLTCECDSNDLSYEREAGSRHNSDDFAWNLVDKIDGLEIQNLSNNKETSIDDLASHSLFSSIGITSSSSIIADEDNESVIKKMGGLRQAVVHSINELYAEIENLYGPICEQAQEYIHADECIFTFGYSTVIEHFFKAAAKKRRFYVIIAEGGPQLEGHKLASALSKVANISTTLVPDSNVYPLMSRINKVIISPHAVLADGGLIASSGTEMVAIAAKDYCVPVICLATTFMLSPVFAHNHSEVLNQLLSPALIMDYNAPINSLNVEVIVAAYDYVPPHYIDTFITNNGTHQPSYMYRLLGEYYHSADYEISAE